MLRLPRSSDANRFYLSGQTIKNTGETSRFILRRLSDARACAPATAGARTADHATSWSARRNIGTLGSMTGLVEITAGLTSDFWKI
jgi:hypothetical protein